MRTSSWLALGLLTIGTVLSTAPARAETITGEVVDLSCYLGHPGTGRGRSHRKCAETCAKKGLPMGILTEDDTVYLLLEDHDKPKGYADALDKAAEEITVEGKLVNEGGLDGIIVQSIQ